MSKRKGSKGADELERLVEAWLQVDGWTTHRAAAVLVTLPGGKKFSRQHDVLGCFDFLAVRRSEKQPPDHGSEVWLLQTTVPDKRASRRDKVRAAGPWPSSCRVAVLHHNSARVGRETLHYFMIEYLDPNTNEWCDLQRVEVNVKALEAHRSAVRAAKKAKREADEAERVARSAAHSARRAERDAKKARAKAERDDSPRDPVAFDDARGRNTHG